MEEIKNIEQGEISQESFEQEAFEEPYVFSEDFTEECKLSFDDEDAKKQSLIFKKIRDKKLAA